MKAFIVTTRTIMLAFSCLVLAHNARSQTNDTYLFRQQYLFDNHHLDQAWSNHQQ